MVEVTKFAKRHRNIDQLMRQDRSDLMVEEDEHDAIPLFGWTLSDGQRLWIAYDPADNDAWLAGTVKQPTVSDEVEQEFIDKTIAIANA